MLKKFENVWKFLSYWYFRYLMVTELYMVERWERAVCNLIIIVLFCILWYLNYIALSYASSFFWRLSPLMTKSIS